MVGEFCAGWEGWLEGDCLAYLSSEVEDAVCIAVVHIGRNGSLILVEEGNNPCTGPWHHDGWLNDFLWHYYFGCLVYMDPFSKQFFNSLEFFSGYLHQKSHIAFNNQVSGNCCWMDFGDWWIFCWLFLLLEIPIE